MKRLDKIEMRWRELEQELDQKVADLLTDTQHPWHRARENSLSKSRIDPEVQDLLRLEREVNHLRGKLDQDPWAPRVIGPDALSRHRSEIKHHSIPRDHRHVIGDREIRESQRPLVERGLPIFERIVMAPPQEITEDTQLIAHAVYRIQLGEVRLTLFPLSEQILDDWVLETFFASVWPQLLAFQAHVRDDPGAYKRHHHECRIWWRDSWFESSPEALPDLGQIL